MTGSRRLGWDEPAPADLFDHIQEPTMDTTASFSAHDLAADIAHHDRPTTKAEAVALVADSAYSIEVQAGALAILVDRLELS